MCKALIALLAILVFGLAGSYHPVPLGKEYRDPYQRQAESGNTASGYDCRNANVSLPERGTRSPTSKSENSAPEKGWSIYDPNSTVAAFTIVLALIGVAQAFVGTLQWRTYGVQTEIFKAQNRAFVYLEPLKIDSIATDAEVTTEWRVRVSFKNSGTTAATRLIVDIRRAALTTTELKSYPFIPDYSRAQKLFLGPQASAEIYGPTFGVQNIEDTFGENKTHILVWGWAEYESVFSNMRHRTEFCFELTGDYLMDFDRPLANHFAPYFVMHRRHNGADGECMHRPQPYQA